MNSTELRECLDAIGWPIRELARRLDTSDGPIRKAAMGKRPIRENLAAWLKMFGAVYAALPPEVREMARLCGCAEGRFIRRPVGHGVRDVVPDEWVPTLELLAALHAAFPFPLGWMAAREQNHQEEDTEPPNPTGL